MEERAADDERQWPEGRQEHEPFGPRGKGTGLSGGALPVEGAVVISTECMRRILEVDPENQRAVVEPGVINLWVTQAVAGQGYYFAPDPSSQLVCSVGGNVAENSGGVHCLKYGVTVNHVLGLEVVLPDGQVVQLGGKEVDAPGYDLVGVFVGSEGTLGIATKITVRLLRKPEAVKTYLAAFETIEAAGGAVSDVLAAGVIPRTTLPQVLAEIERMTEQFGLRCANVFHAGDGNLHPLILYDEKVPGSLERAEEFGGAILRLCVEVGGSITGEHGVGLDKKAYMPSMFTPDDLDTMQLVRCAFDPRRLSNPNKVFPTPRLCAERGGPYRPHPLEQAGVLERF